MTLEEIGGEFGLIARLQSAHGGASGGDLSVPMGDDAAVLSVPAGCQSVVTTDMLLDGVHFRRDWSDAYSIGWKSAAVNLSDIAAMGASPTFAFVSLALPAAETVEFLDRFYDGLTDALHRYGARLAGGDTNKTNGPLTISVTLLGTIETGEAWTRGGARVGDALFVTGTLGGASLGLELLTRHGKNDARELSRELVETHRRPQARVLAARALRATGKIHAAMDISDGLRGDLPKLCAASKVGAHLELAALPVSGEMRRVAPTQNLDAQMLALNGGDDYELLLAAAPADAEVLTNAVAAFGLPLTRVGEIVKGGGVKIFLPNGAEMPDAPGGWDHFAP